MMGLRRGYLVIIYSEESLVSGLFKLSAVILTSVWIYSLSGDVRLD